MEMIIFATLLEIIPAVDLVLYVIAVLMSCKKFGHKECNGSNAHHVASAVDLHCNGHVVRIIHSTNIVWRSVLQSRSNLVER